MCQSPIKLCRKLMYWIKKVHWVRIWIQKNFGSEKKNNFPATLWKSLILNVFCSDFIGNRAIKFLNPLKLFTDSECSNSFFLFFFDLLLKNFPEQVVFRCLCASGRLKPSRCRLKWGQFFRCNGWKRVLSIVTRIKKTNFFCLNLSLRLR